MLRNHPYKITQITFIFIVEILEFIIIKIEGYVPKSI